MAEVEAAIRDYISREFLADRADVALTDDMDLMDAEIIDSLGIFILVDFLQEHFGIVIDAGEVILDNFETVTAVASLVGVKLESKAGSAE